MWAGRAASLALGLALLVTSTRGAAEAGAGAGLKWRVGPFFNARATDTGQAVALGIDANPSSLSTFGGRLSAIVQKASPNELQAEASNARYAFGVSLLLLGEFGRAKPKDAGAKPKEAAAPEAADVSVFGAGLETSWFFANYQYQPYGRPHTVLGYSFNVEARGFWFTTLRPPTILSTPTTGALIAGNRPPAEAVNHGAWLTQPQIRLGYGRRVQEAPDSYVVLPPLPGGLQLAERMKLTPPSYLPAATVLLAMPISPPSGRFAFGPALRFTAWGPADTWSVWSEASSGRGRLELWLYHFVWNDSPAVRVGIAPFLDTPLYGPTPRDGLVGGALLEVRASTSRLEY